MNKIKAAIIEDEVPAARLLHEMIQSLRPDWEVMILPGTIEESVEWFHVNPHPELLFLDIQLTDGKSFVVTGNKVDVNAGNAFWFHNAATNGNVTYTISNNDIKAPYIGYYGTSFDVNDKITSSGNDDLMKDDLRSSMAAAVVDSQGDTSVDAITSSTLSFSVKAVQEAVADCIAQAKA